MSHSLIASLTLRHPGCTIDVVAPPVTVPVFARMAEVREAIPLDIGHGEFGLRRRYRLGRALAPRRYTQAIVLPNSWKSALVPYFARIPRRTGYVGEQRYGVLNEARRLDERALPTTVGRFVALAGEADDTPVMPPVPRLVPDTDAQRTALVRLALQRPRAPLLAVCPGAEYGPAKRWPVAHFATVASAVRARGWEVWVFGSAKDRAAGREIAGQAAGVVDLTGRTAIDEAIDLMALADCVLTNDSGLMHVACALDRRVVALYGSSDPGHTPPLSARAEVLRTGISCSPCFERECPLGHLRCLTELTPERVLAAIGAA